VQNLLVQNEMIARRVANNQSAFRDANEDLERRAHQVDPSAPSLPFICECPDPGCTSIAWLSIVEYETVRSHGDWFLVVRGHEVLDVDNQLIARVEKRYDHFSIMEKVGRAGELAEQLDPRARRDSATG
jgi:hypothetical protein